MKLKEVSPAGVAGRILHKLNHRTSAPNTDEARMAAARAIDEGLAQAYRALEPMSPQGTLRGLDVPMRTGMKGDEPYVFLSRIKPYVIGEGFSRYPAHFRAVDETLFCPCSSHEQNAIESLRITTRLQEFIKEIRRAPEHLLEPLPGFCYHVKQKDAQYAQTREWPSTNVLEYALLERNTIIAGVIAAELANLARSPAYGDKATQMLRDCVALAIKIEDGPYASMLLMGLAVSQPKSWLGQRIATAVTSTHPVAAALHYYQDFAGQLLGLESRAWKAHWLHHDPSVRDFIATCTIDTLLYAADVQLQQAFDTDCIHRNHFMHGTMVLTELESRIARASVMPASPKTTTQTARTDALARANYIVEVLRLDRSAYSLHDKIAFLNERFDDAKLTVV